MKVTVCELDARQLEQEWSALKTHVRENQSDVLLLPEMPFAPWFAADSNVDPAVWEQSVDAHVQWIKRLPELGVSVVLGTLPVNEDGARLNVGFTWTAEDGVSLVHAKTYLPDEAGFWEASWYDRGPVDFTVATVGDLCVGYLICTELWFSQHARDYANEGVHLLLCPRCTPKETVSKWIIGGQAAAVIGGAYCLSSNHAGEAHDTQLGGTGWIADPDGELLGTTSADSAFLTVDIDLAKADHAKTTYPRYVIDTAL